MNLETVACFLFCLLINTVVYFIKGQLAHINKVRKKADGLVDIIRDGGKRDSYTLILYLGKRRIITLVPFFYLVTKVMKPMCTKDNESPMFPMCCVSRCCLKGRSSDNAKCRESWKIDGINATDMRSGTYTLSTYKEVQMETLFDIKSVSDIACGSLCLSNDECEAFAFDSDSSKCLGFSRCYQCKVTPLPSTTKLYQSDQRQTEPCEKTWSVVVKTSDISDAGTNADVYIAMYGQSEKTDDIYLDNDDNNFERDQHDTFIIKTKDVGKLLKLKVLFIEDDYRPSWHLDEIVIESMECKEKFVFSCGCWIYENDDIYLFPA